MGRDGLTARPPRRRRGTRLVARPTRLRRPAGGVDRAWRVPATLVRMPGRGLRSGCCLAGPQRRCGSAPRTGPALAGRADTALADGTRWRRWSRCCRAAGGRAVSRRLTREVAHRAVPRRCRPRGRPSSATTCSTGSPRTADERAVAHGADVAGAGRTARVPGPSAAPRAPGRGRVPWRRRLADTLVFRREMYEELS